MLSTVLGIQDTRKNRNPGPQGIHGLEGWKKSKQIMPQVLLKLFGEC